MHWCYVRKNLFGSGLASFVHDDCSLRIDDYYRPSVDRKPSPIGFVLLSSLRIVITEDGEVESFDRRRAALRTNGQKELVGATFEAGMPRKRLLR